MDEEELQKRFTDCVYFLASPLTCKKGIECIYRHNEIARLNPRDCWYWLGGCCYNPECAFRHPPLEGLMEAYHESLNPSNGPTLPVDKTNVPCYFYSKGFCNKADRCSFLHQPTDCNKTMVRNEVSCEKPLPIGTNIEPTPVQVLHTHLNTTQSEHTHTVMNHTPDSDLLVSRSESVESEENVEREEFVESEENIVESEEIVVDNESDVYNDQSSDGYLERDKWLDLSPRFDVLVDHESEDVDSFSVNHEENPEPDFHYSSRVSIFNRLSFKKKSIHKKLIFNVHRDLDLRDRLKKSKVDFNVDFDHRVWRNLRPRGSRGEVDFDHDCDRRRWLKKAAHVNRYKPHLKKPHFLSSDVSWLRKPGQQSAVFTGPKTLDQIKEEKKRAWEGRDFGSGNRIGSDGFFQGPRPLCEILKNKRKLG